MVKSAPKKTTRNWCHEYAERLHQELRIEPPHPHLISLNPLTQISIFYHPILIIETPCLTQTHITQLIKFVIGHQSFSAVVGRLTPFHYSSAATSLCSGKSFTMSWQTTRTKKVTYTQTYQMPSYFSSSIHETKGNSKGKFWSCKRIESLVFAAAVGFLKREQYRIKNLFG